MDTVTGGIGLAGVAVSNGKNTGGVTVEVLVPAFEAFDKVEAVIAYLAAAATAGGVSTSTGGATLDILRSVIRH